MSTHSHEPNESHTAGIHTNGASHVHHEEGGHHLHGGPKVYTTVLAVLLTLTVITVGASKVDFGSPSANVVIALIIATIKATVVALWFMHLKYDKAVNGMIFASTLFFLALFFAYPYIDTISRTDSRPSNWKGPAYMPDTGKAVEGIGANFPVRPLSPPPGSKPPEPAAHH